MNRNALLSIALRPKTAADRERLARGVTTLMAEDPAMSVEADPATGEFVIAGIGERHLEIIIDRLREFNVEAAVGRLQVAYRETLTRPASGEGRYAPHGQYGHVKIHLHPGETGSGFVFENAIVGGAIPNTFVTPIAEGIEEALTAGIVAGYPVADVRVVLYDGSYHDVESSDISFRIAGVIAFRDAAAKAGPVLLEPVMRVEVTTPPEYAGDVIGSLSSRRGQIRSQEGRGGAEIIQVRVPLSAMLGYAIDLRSRTRGRGTFVMEFESYQPCDPGENQGADDSMVGAPRRPRPPLRDSSVALPEPLEE